MNYLQFLFQSTTTFHTIQVQARKFSCYCLTHMNKILYEHSDFFFFFYSSFIYPIENNNPLLIEI